jgi:hypothetical protein
MLVRAVRSRQRAGFFRVAALAAFGIAASHPRPLIGQEPTADRPATHTVKRGDTLWDIAKTYLGDSFLWPEIYRLNTDLIEDPHWIYPGELLKLPGAQAKVLAVTPPVSAPDQPPVAGTTAGAPSTVLVPTVAPTAPAPVPSQLEAPRSTVRTGEYVASPWVDQRGGPAGSGFIMQAVNLPGIASGDHSRVQLFDPVIVALPDGAAGAAGATAARRELLLSYRLGPLIEDMGQVVIPTGVIEITRSPGNGEASTGRVVRMFGEILQGQRLIPYDSTGAIGRGNPALVSNGRVGKIRWLNAKPVLPSLQNYAIVDISKAEVGPGDQVELFKPKQPPADGRDLTIPEVFIARAQVLRVTPYGATVMITSQVQPKIEEGTAVRVSAKIP